MDRYHGDGMHRIGVSSILSDWLISLGSYSVLQCSHVIPCLSSFCSRRHQSSGPSVASSAQAEHGGHFILVSRCSILILLFVSASSALSFSLSLSLPAFADLCSFSRFSFSRMFLSIFTGCCAGVLGFTGLSGFLFYFASAVLATGLLFVKAGTNSVEYFQSKSAIADGIGGGLLSFVLFWT
jgi:hypothetical protein